MTCYSLMQQRCFLYPFICAQRENTPLSFVGIDWLITLIKNRVNSLSAPLRNRVNRTDNHSCNRVNRLILSCTRVNYHVAPSCNRVNCFVTPLHRQAIFWLFVSIRMTNFFPSLLSVLKLREHTPTLHCTVKVGHCEKKNYQSKNDLFVHSNEPK